MVDHTFVYTGAVRKMRELVPSGDLGDIYYYDSVRVNLGLFQHDVNVSGTWPCTTCRSWTTCCGAAGGGVGDRHRPRAGRAGEHRLPDAALRRQR